MFAKLREHPEHKARLIVQVMSVLSNKEPLQDEASSEVVTRKSLEFYRTITRGPVEPAIASSIRLADTLWSPRSLQGVMSVQGKEEQTKMLFLANGQPSKECTLPTVAILFSCQLQECPE